MLIMLNLRQNARQTLTRMSRKTSIPISTIYDKLRKHEQDIIKRHTCLLDFSKLGYSTRATVMIQVPRSQREEVQEFLSRSVCVNTLMKINNDFDFFFEAICKQIRDVEDFIETLEEKFSIKKKKVYYVIDEIKREGFLSDPMHMEMLVAEE